MKREIHPLDIEMVRIAKNKNIKEFIRAILEHPVDGKLMRAFAMEENTPEYKEFLREMEDKFGVSISGQSSDSINGGGN